MNVWRAVASGWRVHVPVVAGNAAVQALAVWPAATPAFSTLFVLLAVVSFGAFVVSLALVAAQARASAAATAFAWPPTGLTVTSAIVVLLAVGVSLLTAFVVPLVLLAALVALPGAAATPARPFAGFRVFSTAPLRAILLALLTLVVIALLWVVALLLGLFVAGPFGAGFTWLVFGVVGVLLVAGWTGLVARAASRA